VERGKKRLGKGRTLHGPGFQELLASRVRFLFLLLLLLWRVWSGAFSEYGGCVCAGSIS
jgi:hypothetical protein